MFKVLYKKQIITNTPFFEDISLELIFTLFKPETQFVFDIENVLPTEIPIIFKASSWVSY